MGARAEADAWLDAVIAEETENERRIANATMTIDQAIEAGCTYDEIMRAFDKRKRDFDERPTATAPRAYAGSWWGASPNDVQPDPVVDSYLARLVGGNGEPHLDRCKRCGGWHDVDAVYCPPPPRARPTPIGEKVAHVRSSTQTRWHECHWPDCGEVVKPSLWGCHAHWKMLPRDIRDRIWATYRPLQEEDGRPSREYLNVAREAQEWIRRFIAREREATERDEDRPKPGEKWASAVARARRPR